MAERAAVAEIVAKCGGEPDPRTVLRAMREGADAIRPRVVRERLRPHVDAWRANLAAVSERAAS